MLFVCESEWWRFEGLIDRMIWMVESWNNEVYFFLTTFCLGISLEKCPVVLLLYWVRWKIIQMVGFWYGWMCVGKVKGKLFLRGYKSGYFSGYESSVKSHRNPPQKLLLEASLWINFPPTRRPTRLGFKTHFYKQIGYAWSLWSFRHLMLDTFLNYILWIGGCIFRRGIDDCRRIIHFHPTNHLMYRN